VTARRVRALLSRLTGRGAAAAPEEAVGAPAHDPGRPAEVERRGWHFWASCRVCPWEGDDRLIHFDAEADAAQHNDSAHLPRPAARLAAD